MNELIKVVTRNGRQEVNARELHTALEAGRYFANWIKDRIEKYGFIEGQDYRKQDTLSLPNSASSKARPQVMIDYYLSLSTAKEIAMVENNEKGREIRQYLIRVEEAWNTPEMALVRGMQAAQQIIEKQQEEIAELAPKAAFADLAMQSKDVLSMNDAAKVLKLGYGNKTLFKELRERGVLTADNVPYQEYIGRGYFKVDETPVLIGDTIQIKKVTRVTQKGLAWLAGKLGGQAPDMQLYISGLREARV